MRLVTCRFIQWESFNYVKTFSLVFKMTSLWVLFSLVALYDYHIHQIDVTTTFLNGTLQEEIYISPLEGFMSIGNETKVCHLLKSLYGLKQASCVWYNFFDNYILSQCFIKYCFDTICHLWMMEKIFDIYWISLQKYRSTFASLMVNNLN